MTFYPGGPYGEDDRPANQRRRLFYKELATIRSLLQGILSWLQIAIVVGVVMFIVRLFI